MALQLIFLLVLAVAMVGFMPAQDAARPPWEITLEAEIACVSAACGCPVHQVTVLVCGLAVTTEVPSLQAVMALGNEESALRPHNGGVNLSGTSARFGQIMSIKF